MEATLNLRHHLYLKTLFCLTKPTSTSQSLSFHSCPMAFPSLHLDARRSPSFLPKPLYVVSCQQRPDDTTPVSPAPLPDSLEEAISESTKKKSFWAKLWYRKPSLRSLYLAALWGPNAEKQALEDAKKAYRDSNFLKTARKEFNEGLAKEHIDWEDLTRAARKLEMAGKEDEAIKKLKRLSKKKGVADAYEASLLNAEMLIYQGKNLLDVEKMLLPILDPQLVDARPHLLLAVALAVREGDSPETMERWNKYVNTRKLLNIRGENLTGPPMESGEVSGPPMVEDHWKVPTKEQFLKLVESLKREINAA